ncbi:hypothetical protein CSC75_04375 [Pseudoxanthomonas wuyuanensis]|nr:hypothetical protein CSC75_04375 [Pseudoxanthomonas wuyuanensis]
MSFAAVSRARTALDVAVAGASLAAKAKAFTEIGWAMLGASNGPVNQILLSHPNDLVQKAVAASTIGGVWVGEDARALAAAYLASVAEESLLDQLARYARMLPINLTRTLVASGFTANVVTEGNVKVVRNLTLSVDEDVATKTAAIIVMTKELVNSSGPQGRALFENELRSSVTRATNQAVLTMLTTSSTETVAGTGDPLEDLRAGLAAAGPSSGYVVAAPGPAVIDLATRVENRGGMGVRGGSFIPGVEIVAMDDIEDIHVMPASRMAAWDGGLELRSAEHASVNMADSPTSPSEVVSLWQTNSLGLIAERSFHLVPSAEMVVVSAGS